MNINAIILAAGFGSRLRPLTEYMPKPLIPVFGSSMLAVVAANLKRAGIDRIAVNTHYLAEQIGDAVAKLPEADSIELFHEPEILGTGGGVVNAKSLLAEGEFFMIHNSDVLTDMDLAAMIEYHKQSGAKVTFALVDGPENRVRVTPDGKVHDILDSLGRHPAGSRLLTYACVMILSREIFDHLPEQPENCSIIRAVLDLMRDQPDAVRGWIPDKPYWRDLGTLPQYFDAHDDVVKGVNTMPLFQNRQRIYFEDEPEIGDGAALLGYVTGGRNCRIGAGSTLINCLLLDNTVVPPGSFHSRQIIGPDGFNLHRDYKTLENYHILKKFRKEPYSISSLIERGSTRSFYRIAQNGKSSILMISDGMDQDYDRFINIGRYFNKHNFPVPVIQDFEAEEFTTLVEDLGDETLYKSLLANGPDETLYRRIIDALVHLQTEGTKIFRKRTAPILRTFDQSYLRWETIYFSDNFLGAFCCLSDDERAALNQEFDALAALVDSHPKVLIHRDFQSHNIMLSPGGVRFVDFQGARFGSAGYDIMSLLNDPYAELTPEMRTRLEDYFRAQHPDMPELEAMMITAGLQRNMQALGAYGFLALTKGKRDYLAYIPAGFQMLKTGLDRLEKLEKPPIRLERLSQLLNNLKLPEVTAEKPRQ